MNNKEIQEFKNMFNVDALVPKKFNYQKDHDTISCDYYLGQINIIVALQKYKDDNYIVCISKVETFPNSLYRDELEFKRFSKIKTFNKALRILKNNL